MLFIGPPFGNYIDLPYTKSIKGSFTIDHRPGLFQQIINTLHYSHVYGGWVNKIGLRNPGIDWAIKKYTNDDILSISILKPEDVETFLCKLSNKQNLEINISCPNVKENLNDSNIHKFLNNEREWCIIKLSPTTTNIEIDELYNHGFKQFHCCNTIPVKEGGLSGTPIIPYTVKKMNYIHSKYDDAIVIAGGGVRNIGIYNMYSSLGATHISASSVFFNPYLALKLYFNYLFKIH